MVKKAVLFFSAALFSALFLIVSASAEEADCNNAEFTVEGFSDQYLLTDGSERSHTAAEEGGSVTVTREDGISFLYIVFDRIPEQWTMTDISDGASAVCGENSFLHEYVDVASKLGCKPKTIRLDFPLGTSIDEIYAFGEGDIPDWVQRWSPPCEQADVLLLSSHADDEQLFFAGVLPIYAGERGLNVQVVYLVSHFYNTAEYERVRPHEQLDGLWTVGVRNYPVMSDFPDLYSESLEEALSVYGWYGFGYDDFTEFLTGVLRRFKPLVVVTHDVNGEYGHGTHVLCAAALMESVELAADETKYTYSAEQYGGTWQPEKVYLHLYPENPIVLDLDVPLSAFDGKTAFQVSQDGFSKHLSQHWIWFYGWMYNVTRAADIGIYSPCYYGLYHTSVGYDTGIGDLMENIVPYAERNAEAPTEEPDETDNGEDTETDVTTEHTEEPPTEEETDTPGASEMTDSENSLLSVDGLILLIIVIAVIVPVAVICIIAVKSKKKRKK